MVACVGEGPLTNLFAIGLGTNKRKQQRASRLALAVAAAAHVNLLDWEDWLSSQAIRIEDPFSFAGAANALNRRAPRRHLGVPRSIQEHPGASKRHTGDTPETLRRPQETPRDSQETPRRHPKAPSKVKQS